MEVLDQAELHESLLEMTKMTAEELAAYSKVQSLLSKIASPPAEAQNNLRPNADARQPVKPGQNINPRLPIHPLQNTDGRLPIQPVINTDPRLPILPVQNKDPRPPILPLQNINQRLPMHPVQNINPRLQVHSVLKSKIAKPFQNSNISMKKPKIRQQTLQRPLQNYPTLQQQRIPPKYVSTRPSAKDYAGYTPAYKIPPPTVQPYKPLLPIGPLNTRAPQQVSLPHLRGAPDKQNLVQRPDPSEMSASEIASFLAKLSGKKEKEKKKEDIVKDIKNEEELERKYEKVSDTYHKTLLGDYKFPDQAFKGFGSIKNEFEKDFLETIYEKPIDEIKVEKEDDIERSSENEKVFVKDPSPDFFKTETDFVKDDIQALKEDLKSIKEGLHELSKKPYDSKEVKKGRIRKANSNHMKIYLFQNLKRLCIRNLKVKLLLKTF